jgi:NAD(P)-dependent dehydrogenase (short-subunit alcohol dehydrogenase family)
VTERLVSLGYTVLAADADAVGLARLAGLPGVITLRADVTSVADLARAGAAAEAGVGKDGLDGLVLCAGVFAAGPLVEVPEADMRRAMDVNLMGAFRTVQALFPLIARRRGTIVAVSSECARSSVPFNGPYTVSKCALEVYCDVLRRELSTVGVRVCIVEPGAFGTGFQEQARRAFGQGAPGSPFAPYLALGLRVLAGEQRATMDPGTVAEVVVRALLARRPRHRYAIGNDPRRLLLGKLPVSWADRLISLYLQVAAPRGRRG